MCGISGIWHLNNSKLEQSKLQKFTDSLAHRGPDGSGYHIFKDVQLGFGHRRLSILDLTDAAKQPMNYNGSNLHITYNGEIYNFIEIKSELKSKGFYFKTESDTEVILAAYLHWGIKCFDKFNGMWAIALYNSESKKLLLCRDRFGVKPFYYTFKANELFAFASETYAFKFLDSFKLNCNENNISRSIDNPVLLEGSGHTIWDEIFQLLPGHLLEIDSQTKFIHQKRWFEIEKKKCTLTYDESKEKFFELFGEAIKLRLRSDVPVGAALSGGLDSSSIYAMLYQLKNKNIKTERANINNIKGFVATFEGTLQDETEYAKSVVEHCKGEAEFLKTNFNSIISNIESSSRLFNDITATPINVLGDVYKSMRLNNYVVSLDGHGADEMLYGYRSLVGMAVSESIMSLNENYEKDLSDTYINMFHTQFQEAERTKLNNRSNELKNLLGVNSALGKGKYSLKKNIKKTFGNNSEIFQASDVIELSYLKKRNVKHLAQLSDKPYDLGYYNIAEKELAIDFCYRNIPYNMRDFDRAAMQHGVEIRMPFMDYNLVNFVFSLPMEYKVGKGYSKRILRDTMKDILPEKVRNRTLKIGMGAPINDWFNNQLNEYILDTVNSHKFQKTNLWDGQKIREMNEAQQFWNILNAHIILS